MNYFSHDSNARNDERILRLRMKHGAAGYGIYFMILERMRDSTNYMCATDYEAIAYELREKEELVKSVVEDFGLFLFTDDHAFFYSASMMKRMEHLDMVSQKRSESGKRGGRPRKQPAEVENPPKEPPKEPVVVYAKDVPPLVPSSEAMPRRNVPSSEACLGEIADFGSLFTTLEQESLCMKFHFTKEQLAARYRDFVLDCRCRGATHLDTQDVKRHFNDWLRIVIESERKKANESAQTNKRRGVETNPSQAKDYNGTF